MIQIKSADNKILFQWEKSELFPDFRSVLKETMAYQNDFKELYIDSENLDTFTWNDINLNYIQFKNLKIIFSKYLCNRLKKEGNEKIFYQFKNYKIEKNEISEQFDNIVMLVRPSMQKDLENITGIDGGNFIYSMWEGYLKKNDTMKFVDYLINRNFTLYKIHTSGHADTKTLLKIVEAIKPKHIVPIHTFEGDIYNTIFKEPIVRLNDGETIEI